MAMRAARKLKRIPRFNSETEERVFWETHDSVDYVDWSKARVVRFPNLQPSTATISLRLPQGVLDELKVLANQRDVPSGGAAGAGAHRPAAAVSAASARRPGALSPRRAPSPRRAHLLYL